MKGKIYSIVSGIYEIKNSDNSTVLIPGSGKLRFNNLIPLVGDYVEHDNKMILNILERRNNFIRPKVANIDQVIIVMSLKEPEFSSFLMDKFLSIIEFKEIKPILFFTKSDLVNDFYWYEQYQKCGYEVYLLNNNSNSNLSEIKQIFKNKTNVFLGQTGVGKTTTINRLSNNNFQTQQISKALGRGKHTTRVVKIIEFNDGELIDTPGFSSLDLDINSLELAQSFDTFKKYFPDCKYRSCLHINENVNDCEIKKQIDISIPKWRYENYLKLSKETKKERWDE